jgi:hypothetical protein
MPAWLAFAIGVGSGVFLAWFICTLAILIDFEQHGSRLG